ncbi:MAG: tRNA 4-thiouridine(8) synthase ThiI [Candidatus Marsarchaeota archaeon]|nr:tRNA 4-thiouridine(8) synthase ThiI [Candidatus Marsarchaeota archaeon]
MNSRGFDCIVIHFGEIAIKGNNKIDFTKKLYANIKHMLDGIKYKKFEMLRDRFVLYPTGTGDYEKSLERLAHVFGLSWYAPALISKSDIDSIIKSAEKIIGKRETVKIIAHRSYKELPFTSPELVGEFIKREHELPFSIDKNSDSKLYISITKERTYMTREKRIGIGGLPVGSSGSAISLFSGGIDSPVASYFAMKKGLELVYLHVHAFNDNEEAAGSKIKELIEVLGRYCSSIRIYYVPAYPFQSAAMRIPHRFELVLFKRFIFKLAGRISEIEGTDAIVTGESLGQVASQTLKNMASSQSGTDQFIFRPLIGLDKNEIIEYAKGIGTFDISIKKYKDVCSISSIRPATGTSISLIDRLSESISLDEVVDRALELAMKKDYTF